MASNINVFDSALSALDDLACLVNTFLLFNTESRLRSLKTFFLCARTLGDNFNMEGSLRSLPLRIAQEISIFYLKVQPHKHSRGRDLYEICYTFPALKRPFAEEIDKWYTALLDSLQLQQSWSPTTDQLTQIIDSLLERLVNADRYCLKREVDALETMEEKIRLFRNLIRFVATQMQSVELQPFVIHVASVAISAARLNSKHAFTFALFSNQMISKISVQLQKIIPTDPQVSQAYKTILATSKLSKDDHDPLDVIDFLLWILWERLHMNSCHLICTKDQLQPLWDGLKFLRTAIILKKEQNKFDERIRDLSRAVVCDSGVIICSLYQKDADIDLGLANLLEKFKMIRAQVEQKDPERSMFNLPKTDALKISHGRSQEIKEEKATWTSTQVPPQNRTPAIDEVVGLEEETKSIVNRLTRGSKKLQVISIVGMPGSGKTTLATKLFDDPNVVCHFHVHRRCSVSQVYNQRKLLLELLPKLPDGFGEKSEDDLAEELRRSLKQRRYIIYLDDVWKNEVWESLKLSLPDDYNGSRILVTIRYSHVVPQDMLDEEPFSLPLLSKDDSWKLLQNMVFPKDGFPQVLDELGKQIADNCKGLPLTIVLVAGLLTTMKTDLWKEVLESLTLGVFSVTEQCSHTLELSYRHLPDNLKPCFLYFGLFPEDEEVSVKQLIRLWIAEEFVLKTELKSLEDVATNYVMDLVRRSLVIVAEKGSISEVKACRIHDLLHEFAKTKAKEETFFSLLRGNDEILAFNEPCALPRLCIHSRSKDLKNLRLFSSDHIHSLLFFSREGNDFSDVLRDVSVILVLKHLKVLDIRNIGLGVFPSEMGFLVQLRYLAVTGLIGEIPSSIGNLSHLQTFMVDTRDLVVLPDTIWDLHELRHLWTNHGFCFPMENLENSSDLYELESCTIAINLLEGISEKLVRKFPKARKLVCRFFEGEDTDHTISILSIPNCLSRLKSLHVSGKWVDMTKCPELRFDLPPNLTKLTLDDLMLTRSGISDIGKLPHLEVLKLLRVSIRGDVLEMAEGEFSNLKFLKLTWLGIVRWIASDDQFPSLEKLVLEDCGWLREIPSCLENTSTLEKIKVKYCSEYVESQVKQIQDVQIEMGNSALGVMIFSYRRF